MKILAKDLPLHLTRALSPFYFVFGDEPLLHQESIEAIRQAAKTKGYTEREVFEVTPHFAGESLLASLNTQSLFSEKRLIECRLMEGKIETKMTEFLIKLAKTPNINHIIFLLSASKIDKKLQQSAWFSQLEQKGCTIVARPLSKKETLLWLEKRLTLTGFQTTPEALQLLFERTEGNLLAAAQTIEKLSLYTNSKTLSMDDILQTVGMDARFTIYDLVDTALSGAVLRTSQIFRSLKEEGIDPILINWAIAREVRTILLLMNHKREPYQLGIWKHREPLVKTFMARFSILRLQQILSKTKVVDDTIKGRLAGNAWDQLFILYLMLTGAYPE